MQQYVKLPSCRSSKKLLKRMSGWTQLIIAQIMEIILNYTIAKTVTNEDYGSAKGIQPVGNVKTTKISYVF